MILCAGAGGGTGAGAIAEMVDVLEYLNFSGKIGVILALPQDTEDSKAKENTIAVLGDLISLSNADKIAPLITIDNAKIRQKFPGISADAFWEKANEEIAKIFHFFNLLTFRGSSYTSLDPADYSKIMKTNGFTVFGRSNVSANELTKDALKQAIDLQISQSRSLLADGFDVFRAQKVGCLVVAKPETMQKIPMDLIESGFAHIQSKIKGGIVFKGVYSFEGVKTDGLELMSIYSGLNSPSRRIHQLYRESKEERIIVDKKVAATSIEDILSELEELD